MAKNTTANNKLALVPASNLTAPANNPLVTSAQNMAIPAKAKKLTLPPMLKPDSIPVGSVTSGEILAVVASISKREDMRGSKLLHLKHESGTEFLLPLTGVIKSALGGFEGAEKAVGKKIFVQRNADGVTSKYGGEKKVYQFDVYLAD